MPEQKREHPMTFQIGVNLWTIYGWSPLETVSPTILKKLAEMGSQYVELIMDEDYNTEEVLLTQKPGFQAVLQDTGMPVSSIASALFWKYNLASQDKKIRDRGVETIGKECRVANSYGAGAILVVAGLQEPHTEYERTYETAIQSLRQAAKFAEDLGVVIGVENVGCNFLTTPREYGQFLRDVDRPSVKAYLDIGNAWGIYGGFPENWIDAVKDQLVRVHVKDFSRKTGYVECGKGNLHWADALKALQKVDYRQPLMVETPPDQGDRGQDIPAGLEAARTSLTWLKGFIANQPEPARDAAR
jgi:L-ribulose-5-phosphate 3-epimerase